MMSLDANGSVPQGESGDHWFRYDRRGLFSFKDPFVRAAQEVVPFLDSQAEGYWTGVHV
jgi:hypothetical protein